MVKFERHILKNGLKVLIHEDDSTPMAALNLLYNVGAKDEQEDKTGFAHLFEHLMFGGSKNVKDFDAPIQMAGGESNAFTNNDVTNYYEIVPAENIETLLWLESDRMASLNINAKSLDIQRKVVVEEFNETCLNQPYGDAWHELMALAFKKHPYRWPTIGLIPEHIKEAQLEDVQNFYNQYYAPNNAIMVLAGNIKSQEILPLIEKWFGDIPPFNLNRKNIVSEPIQKEIRRKELVSEVPLDAIYMVFHIPSRSNNNYYTADLISDILGNGKSSRLHKNLRKKERLFADIDAYVTGTFDPGLLVIEGRLAEGVSHEEAEKKIWTVIDDLKKEEIADTELQKYRNKAVSALIFNNTNLLSRAMNLAFFECLGDAEELNFEQDKYYKVSTKAINKMANELLIPSNCSILTYQKKA